MSNTTPAFFNRRRICWAASSNSLFSIQRYSRLVSFEKEAGRVSRRLFRRFNLRNDEISPKDGGSERRLLLFKKRSCSDCSFPKEGGRIVNRFRTRLRNCSDLRLPKDGGSDSNRLPNNPKSRKELRFPIESGRVVRFRSGMPNPRTRPSCSITPKEKVESI